MTQPEDLPIPEWKLERFLLGELPSEEMRRIQSQMEKDKALAGWLEALKTEYSDLRADHPAGRLAEGIRSRLARAPEAAGRQAPEAEGRDAASATRARPSASASVHGRGAWRGIFSVPAVWGPALAMLLILAAIPLRLFKGAPDGEAGIEDTRIKGMEPALLVYRKTGDGSQPLHTGEKARGGDLIQVYYVAAGLGYGALFSLDAEGRVTRHLPDTGNLAASLKAGGPVPLGFAFELDDSRGWERFYFVTSDRPFGLDGVLSALGRKARGATPGDSILEGLPQAVHQNIFTLLKDSGT